MRHDEFEIEIDDYNGHSGMLAVEVSSTYEDHSFDHAFGTHECGQYEPTKIEATLFLVGNNGEGMGEIQMNEPEVLKLVPYEEILERVND